MDRENTTKRIVPAMNGDTGAYYETRIGGKLIIEDGASVIGMPHPAAENIADSTAEDVAGLVSDFNDLLDALKAAGLMEADD